MAHIWSQHGGVGEKEGTSDLTRTDAQKKGLWEIQAEATLIKPEKRDEAGGGNPSPSHKEGPGVTGLELT